MNPLSGLPSQEVPPRKRLPGKRCNDCDSVIHAKAEICPKCGVRQLPLPLPAMAAPVEPVVAVSTPVAGRSRLVAALLALFLGPLGFHAFYLGQRAKGLAFLVPTVAGMALYLFGVLGLLFGVVESSSVPLLGLVLLSLVVLTGWGHSVALMLLSDAAFELRFGAAAAPPPESAEADGPGAGALAAAA